MATTTQRGYGWDHQRARAQALDDLQPETPCPYCVLPMVKGMALDYDHYPPLALGPGVPRVRRLTHAECNRRAGQALAQQRKRARSSRRVVNSRRW